MRRGRAGAGRAPVGDRRRGGGPDARRGRPRPARPGRRGLSELARAQGQVAVWKAYGEALATGHPAAPGRGKDATDKGLDLENEREEIAIATDVSRKVGAEVEAVQVELGAPGPDPAAGRGQGPRARRTSSASSRSRRRPRRLGAFACALLGVSFWEFRARRIDAVDEVVNGLGIRLVGTLPALPRRVRRSGRPADEPRTAAWQSRLVESVDAMRTVLLHASRVEATRVVMVTSAVKGEGKTSLACHLADQPGPGRPQDAADRLRPPAARLPPPLRRSRRSPASARCSAARPTPTTAIRDGLESASSLHPRRPDATPWPSRPSRRTACATLLDELQEPVRLHRRRLGARSCRWPTRSWSARRSTRSSSRSCATSAGSRWSTPPTSGSRPWASGCSARSSRGSATTPDGYGYGQHRIA